MCTNICYNGVTLTEYALYLGLWKEQLHEKTTDMPFACGGDAVGCCPCAFSAG